MNAVRYPMHRSRAIALRHVAIARAVRRMVHSRLIRIDNTQDCGADHATAVRARPFLQELDRCEGVAAEGKRSKARALVSSGAAAQQLIVPANASQTRPSTPLPGQRPKIDLNAVPSSMEQMAASWKGNR